MLCRQQRGRPEDGSDLSAGSAINNPWCISPMLHLNSGPAWGWVPRGEDARPGVHAVTPAATLRSSSWANGAQIPDPRVKPADLHAKRCHNGREESPITDVAEVKRSLPLWMDKIQVLRPQVWCRTSGRRGRGVCCGSVCWRAADASVKRRPYLFPPSSAAFVSAFISTSNESKNITDPRQEFGNLICEHRVRQQRADVDFVRSCWNRWRWKRERETYLLDVDAVFHCGVKISQTNLQINASVQKCDFWPR